MISPKQLAALGWFRTNPGQTFARYEHLQGWRLLHCNHPTALFPFTLFNPCGQAIAAPNGRNFQNVTKAVQWLAETYPDTVPPIAPQPLAELPLFDQGDGIKFVHIGPKVMRGSQRIAEACSKTMAKRIANALNIYKPNREGV